MDFKDAAIAAAILSSSNNVAAHSMATLRDSNRTEAETERIKNESEVSSIRAETRKLEMVGEQARMSDARRDIDNLERDNYQLSRKMQRMEAEMNEMRAMMKEWVSSQRGLLALAKELRKEAESCPNKEHHKLASQEERDKVAFSAAQEAYDEADNIGVPKGIPVYTPTWKKNAGL